jgi:hypothetical protein
MPSVRASDRRRREAGEQPWVGCERDLQGLAGPQFDAFEAEPSHPPLAGGLGEVELWHVRTGPGDLRIAARGPRHLA